MTLEKIQWVPENQRQPIERGKHGPGVMRPFRVLPTDISAAMESGKHLCHRISHSVRPPFLLSFALHLFFFHVLQYLHFATSNFGLIVDRNWENQVCNLFVVEMIPELMSQISFLLSLVSLNLLKIVIFQIRLVAFLGFACFCVRIQWFLLCSDDFLSSTSGLYIFLRYFFSPLFKLKVCISWSFISNFIKLCNMLA